MLQSTPFLDIHQRVWQSGEAGMISMAFDPGYSNPASPGYGLFYVYFVQTPGTGQSNGPIRIEEFTADPASNVASTAAPRLVLEIPHNDANNHYGGTLQFRPTDGLLYIGTGDGGGSDNQYGNAYGLRNPFRWSFDRATGDMVIGGAGDDRAARVGARAARTLFGGGVASQVWSHRAWTPPPRSETRCT